MSPENKDEDRRFLIQHLTETVVFEYDYKKDTVYFDPFYKEFIDFDIKSGHETDLEWLYSATYRPHIGTVREFMDLAGVKENMSRRITVRQRAASGNYEWFRLTMIGM